MEAVAVFPEARQVRMVEHPEPLIASPTQVKLKLLEIGLCGTDREIGDFHYGTPPNGCDYLILGHESLAQVIEAGAAVTGLAVGDLAVCAVRRPCGEDECEPCAGGYQDFCLTGRYTECGILRRHGFLTHFTVEEAEYVSRVPPNLREVAVLTEPLTIAEKALEQVQHIQQRLPWTGWNALVLGAGAVGLLGAMALKVAGFDVTVYSRFDGMPQRREVAEAIGARFISAEDCAVDHIGETIGPIDLVYEAAGSPELTFGVLPQLGANGIFVVTGAGGPSRTLALDGKSLLIEMIRHNQVVLGTVNASGNSFKRAIRDLMAFEDLWPGALRNVITNRIPLRDAPSAVCVAAGIKTIVEVNA